MRGAWAADLRGMFAFAIWDRKRGARLFLARDAMAEKKPLFLPTGRSGMLHPVPPSERKRGG